MITYTYFCLCGKTNCRDVYRNSFIRPLLFLEKVFESHFDAPKKARLFIIFWLCRQKFVGRGKFRKQLAKGEKKFEFLHYIMFSDWSFHLVYMKALLFCLEHVLTFQYWWYGVIWFGIIESLAVLPRTCFEKVFLVAKTIHIATFENLQVAGVYLSHCDFCQFL